MIWDAAPTGKRGRQPTYSDTAIQTCLTMKVLFGMALRQTTGFVESLLRLIGLNWAVPDFSTLSRRQKTLAVNIPYRGSNGLVHLLIDSTGIKVEGEGEWNARKHPSRRNCVSTAGRRAGPSGASGARSISGSTNKHWKSEPLKSPGATWVMRRSCPICSTRSRRTRRSAASLQTVPMIQHALPIPLHL